MNDEVHIIAREPRRLASIFDDIPSGTPLSLDELELAMSRDIERRCVAALDRALDHLSQTGNHSGLGGAVVAFVSSVGPITG